MATVINVRDKKPVTAIRMCGNGAGVGKYSTLQDMLFILFPQHRANSYCEKQCR